ncbi:hypothetical protein SP41844_2078 [Streptococcus pneumoniae]|nr:hypothetical protein SP41844_2078 [Streptococcus pneumoniae]
MFILRHGTREDKPFLRSVVKCNVIDHLSFPFLLHVPRLNSREITTE